MSAFLITGNPGSGKTTLAAELVRRGFVAIDPDYDAKLSYSVDETGGRTLRSEGPALPDEQWLEIDENRIPEPGEPITLVHGQKLRVSANGQIFTLDLK